MKTLAERVERIETALLLLEECRDAKSNGMSSVHIVNQLDNINAEIRDERWREELTREMSES